MDSIAEFFKKNGPKTPAPSHHSSKTPATPATPAVAHTPAVASTPAVAHTPAVDVSDSSSHGSRLGATPRATLRSDVDPRLSLDAPTPSPVTPLPAVTPLPVTQQSVAGREMTELEEIMADVS